MKLVVATRNAGKLAEYRHMLDGFGFKALTLTQAGIGPEVVLPEDGNDFETNAFSKTRALQDIVGGWALGDDSGLEVDALNGAPGVFSARYAGFKGEASDRDRANLAKLLSALQDVPDQERTARFVCAIAMLGPDGQLITSRGTCQGSIIRIPRGSNGFGYDPAFVPEGYQRTMAELSMDEKNSISHRGRALKSLVEKIRKSLY